MLPLQALALVLGVRLARTQLPKVCSITLHTSLLSPASTAPVLAVVAVGLVHMYVSLNAYVRMYVYVCPSVSMYTSLIVC